MALVRGGITVKPHVQAFADALERELGQTLSFGTYQGHSPPEGPTQAIDIFNPVNEAGYAQQDRICEFAFQNAAKFGLRYAIRRHHIKNIERLAEGWRDQGTTGNVTVDHLDHTHLTFYASAGNYSEPDVPAPVKGMDMSSLAVRFIYRDTTPGRVGKLDYVFDGPAHIFAPVGSRGVLKACDECDMPAIGDIEDGDWDWFSAQAKKWEK